MVDTINPNTNEPDQLGNDRFYGGFDKPDDVKINLADGLSQATESPAEPMPTAPVQPAVPTQPVQDMAPQVAPSEVKHTSYVNTAGSINWRGVMVIGIIGLIVTILSGLGIFFGVGAMNNAKLNQQQAELDSIKSELATLSETPNPLELPVVETPAVAPTPTPVVETPVVAPVVTPTPVVTPVPATPTDTNAIQDLG
jgi:hypothetical protein